MAEVKEYDCNELKACFGKEDKLAAAGIQEEVTSLMNFQKPAMQVQVTLCWSEGYARRISFGPT